MKLDLFGAKGKDNSRNSANYEVVSSQVILESLVLEKKDSDSEEEKFDFQNESEDEKYENISSSYKRMDSVSSDQNTVNRLTSLEQESLFTSNEYRGVGKIRQRRKMLTNSPNIKKRPSMEAIINVEKNLEESGQFKNPETYRDMDKLEIPKSRDHSPKLKKGKKAIKFKKEALNHVMYQSVNIVNVQSPLNLIDFENNKWNTYDKFYQGLENIRESQLKKMNFSYSTDEKNAVVNEYLNRVENITKDYLNVQESIKIDLNFPPENLKAAFILNGKFIIYSYSNMLILLAVTDDEIKFSQFFIGHTNTITDFSFSEPEDFVISGSLDKSIKIYQRESGKLIDTIHVETEVQLVKADKASYLYIVDKCNIFIYQYVKKGAHIGLYEKKVKTSFLCSLIAKSIFLDEDEPILLLQFAKQDHDTVCSKIIKFDFYERNDKTIILSKKNELEYNENQWGFVVGERGYMFYVEISKNMEIKMSTKLPDPIIIYSADLKYTGSSGIGTASKEKVIDIKYQNSEWIIFTENLAANAKENYLYVFKIDKGLKLKFEKCLIFNRGLLEIYNPSSNDGLFLTFDQVTSTLALEKFKENSINISLTMNKVVNSFCINRFDSGAIVNFNDGSFILFDKYLNLKEINQANSKSQEISRLIFYQDHSNTYALELNIDRISVFQRSGKKFFEHREFVFEAGGELKIHEHFQYDYFITEHKNKGLTNLYLCFLKHKVERPLLVNLPIDNSLEVSPDSFRVFFISKDRFGVLKYKNGTNSTELSIFNIEENAVFKLYQKFKTTHTRAINEEDLFADAKNDKFGIADRDEVSILFLETNSLISINQNYSFKFVNKQVLLSHDSALILIGIGNLPLQASDLRSDCIIIHDLQTIKHDIIFVFRDQSIDFLTIKFTYDDKNIMYLKEKRNLVWLPIGSENKQILPSLGIYDGIEVSPDGNYIACYSFENKQPNHIRIFDIRKNYEIKIIKDANSRIIDFKFCKFGDQLEALVITYETNIIFYNIIDDSILLKICSISNYWSTLWQDKLIIINAQLEVKTLVYYKIEVDQGTLSATRGQETEFLIDRVENWTKLIYENIDSYLTFIWGNHEGIVSKLNYDIHHIASFNQIKNSQINHKGPVKFLTLQTTNRKIISASDSFPIIIFDFDLNILHEIDYESTQNTEINKITFLTAALNSPMLSIFLNESDVFMVDSSEFYEQKIKIEDQNKVFTGKKLKAGFFFPSGEDLALINEEKTPSIINCLQGMNIFKKKIESSKDLIGFGISENQGSLIFIKKVGDLLEFFELKAKKNYYFPKKNDNQMLDLMCISPGGPTLAMGTKDNSQLLIYNFETKKEFKLSLKRKALCLAVSHDGLSIATGGKGGIEYHSGDENYRYFHSHTTNEPSITTYDVSFANKTRGIILSWNSQGLMQKLKVDNGVEKFYFESPPIKKVSKNCRIACSPNDMYVALCLVEESLIFLYDFKNLNNLRSFGGFYGEVYGLEFSPCFKLTALVNRNQVFVWDLDLENNESQAYVLPLIKNYNKMKFLPSSHDKLFLAKKNSLICIDLNKLAINQNNGPALQVIHSNKGKVFAVIGENNIRICDSLSGAVLITLCVKGYRASFSLDDKFLFLGTSPLKILKIKLGDSENDPEDKFRIIKINYLNYNPANKRTLSKKGTRESIDETNLSILQIENSISQGSKFNKLFLLMSNFELRILSFDETSDELSLNNSEKNEKFDSIAFIQKEAAKNKKAYFLLTSFKGRVILFQLFENTTTIKKIWKQEEVRSTNTNSFLRIAKHSQMEEFLYYPGIGKLSTYSLHSGNILTSFDLRKSRIRRIISAGFSSNGSVIIAAVEKEESMNLYDQEVNSGVQVKSLLFDEIDNQIENNKGKGPSSNHSIEIWDKNSAYHIRTVNFYAIYKIEAMSICSIEDSLVIGFREGFSFLKKIVNQSKMLLEIENRKILINNIEDFNLKKKDLFFMPFPLSFTIIHWLFFKNYKLFIKLLFILEEFSKKRVSEEDQEIENFSKKWEENIKKSQALMLRNDDFGKSALYYLISLSEKAENDNENTLPLIKSEIKMLANNKFFSFNDSNSFVKMKDKSLLFNLVANKFPSNLDLLFQKLVHKRSFKFIHKSSELPITFLSSSLLTFTGTSSEEISELSQKSREKYDQFDNNLYRKFPNINRKFVKGFFLWIFYKCVYLKDKFVSWVDFHDDAVARNQFPFDLVLKVCYVSADDWINMFGTLSKMDHLFYNIMQHEGLLIAVNYFWNTQIVNEKYYNLVSYFYLLILISLNLLVFFPNKRKTEFCFASGYFKAAVVADIMILIYFAFWIFHYVFNFMNQKKKPATVHYGSDSIVRSSKEKCLMYLKKIFNFFFRLALKLSRVPFWVLIDFGIISLGIISCSLDLRDSISNEPNKEVLKWLFALFFFITWAKLFQVAKGFYITSMVVRLLKQVFVKSYGFFIVLFGLVIWAASFSFILQTNYGENSPMKFYITFYYLLLGDGGYFQEIIGESDKEEKATSLNKEIFYFIFFLFTVFIVIIMLNLFISIISESYEKFMNIEKEASNFEKLKIINAFFESKSNAEKKKILDEFKGLYIFQMESKYFSKGASGEQTLSDKLEKMNEKLEELSSLMKPPKSDAIEFEEEMEEDGNDLLGNNGEVIAQKFQRSLEEIYKKIESPQVLSDPLLHERITTLELTLQNILPVTSRIETGFNKFLDQMKITLAASKTPNQQQVFTLPAETHNQRSSYDVGIINPEVKEALKTLSSRLRQSYEMLETKLQKDV